MAYHSNSKPKNYGKVFFESVGGEAQPTSASSNTGVSILSAVTPKQVKYATDIANLLDLPLPNLNDLQAVTEFITSNKNRFYETKRREDEARESNRRDANKVVNEELCLRSGESVAEFLFRIFNE